MKKKIAFVLVSPSPYGLNRISELNKYSEFELYLFFEFSKSLSKEDWSIKSLKNCTIEIINSFLINKKTFMTIPYKLPFLIYKYKPDIVITSNAKQSVFCLPLRLILNFKVGIVVEDSLHAVKTTNPINNMFKTIIYRSADFYLPFSKDAIKYLKSIKIRKPMYPASWSIDLDHFKNADLCKISRIKKEFNTEDKLVFLTVARLDSGKGIINYLSAINKMPSDILDNLIFLIIGSGPQKEELELFIKKHNLENVYLLGYKIYEEIVNYYHAADVFVLPTLKDLFSLVVMEAMACGLPVLTTIYNGARELIREGENGYIFDSANIQDIKKVLVKVYKNRDKLKEMGSVSLEIIKDYSHEKVMKNLKIILEQI
jgi:glycosyltransferase involved in cell wall biosynthesis